MERKPTVILTTKQSNAAKSDADGFHPVGGTQETQQRRGKHLSILLPHLEQQDALQRSRQAHAPDNSPLRMD